MSGDAPDDGALAPGVVFCVEVVSAAHDQTRRDESTPVPSPIESRERLGEIVRATGGEVIDSSLEGLYAVFQDAAAVPAVVTRLLAATTDTRIRIGIHLGPVHTGRPVYGAGPLTASAIARLARPEQALCSEETVLAMPQDVSWGARRLHGVALPGLHGPTPLYRIETQGHIGAASATLHAETESGPVFTRLELVHGADVYQCDAASPELTLGRTSANDVVVRSDLTSRQHARIEKRGHRFVIEDMSANGTVIIDDDGTETMLRSDEATLMHGGLLCLGGRAEKNPEGLLRFRCLE
jgi:hypothetical protein